jgi:hypothetical protein
MGALDQTRDLVAYIESLGREAISRHGVPASLAVSAGGVTLRRFGGEGGWHACPAGRVRAYFWGVVRKRALSSGREVADLRERYVAATVAADMLQGRNASGCTHDQLHKGVRGASPCDALQST